MTDARLSAAAVEALTDGTPARRLSATAVEALTDGTPARRLSAASVEVLTPSALVTVTYVRSVGSSRPIQEKQPGGTWAPLRSAGT